MTPPVANAAAHVQVAIAVGTFPVSTVLGLLSALFFGLDAAIIAGVSTMVAGMSMSLFVPFFGLALSLMGVGKGGTLHITEPTKEE